MVLGLFGNVNACIVNLYGFLMSFQTLWMSKEVRTYPQRDFYLRNYAIMQI